MEKPIRSTVIKTVITVTVINKSEKPITTTAVKVVITVTGVKNSKCPPWNEVTGFVNQDINLCP